MATLPGWKTLTQVCDPLAKAGTDNACGFGALMKLIRNGINDLVIISTILVVIAIVIAGMKLVTSRGNPRAMSDVKEMFGKIVTGYAIILGAWLVVYTITSTLLYSDFNLLIGSP